jgi:hypothetical protein
MTGSGTDNAYICTVSSVTELLQRVAARVHAWPYDAKGFQHPMLGEPDRPSRTWLFAELAPDRKCTGWLSPAAPGDPGYPMRFLLLEFRQAQGFPDVKAWETYLRGLTPGRLPALASQGPITQIQIGLGSAPSPLTAEARQHFSDAEWWEWWRGAKKLRLKAHRRTALGQSIYINPCEQKVDDVFFQLAVIVLQETTLSETETDVLAKAMVRYLRKFPECKDRDIACRVLDSVRRNFAALQDWRGLWMYLTKTANGLATNKRKEGISPVSQKLLLDEGRRVYSPLGAAKALGVDKSTVYRSMQKDSYVDVDGFHGFSEAQLEEYKQRRELAKERAKFINTYATARKIDQKSALRQFQRWEKQGFTPEQIREKVRKAALLKSCMDKGIPKHYVKKHIKDALARGDTLEDIAKALLSQE